jgi:hypothetical protein
MNFPEEFENWLASAFAVDVPDTVVAYSFNIFEIDSSDAKYGIELIGASEFDADNMDWACDEAWVPNPRALSIPLAFANGDWKACLVSAKQLVHRSLGSASRASTKIMTAEAVAIGFVDGDLELIWQR